MAESLNVEGKREEVERIICSLRDGGLRLSPQRTLLLLQKLKALGRQAQGADAIFTAPGIEALGLFALDRSHVEVSREALGCLANATLLRPDTRQIVVNFGYGPRIASMYQEAVALEDTFLCARLLLMLSDRTNLDFGNLINDYGLAHAIKQAINVYDQESRPANFAERPGGPTREMALSETLKLLYSTLSQCPDQSKHFRPAIGLLARILTRIRLDHPDPLEPPVNHIINALFKLEVTASDVAVLFPKTEPRKLARVLIKLLNRTIDTYPALALDLAAGPTLGLLGELYTVGPEGVKTYIREELLPSNDERDRPLGQADTLPAKLLRLSTSSHNPELREVIPVILFQLSDRNPEAFVENVGYGFASGFLTNNHIAYAPQESVTVKTATGTNDVNFVTGQYLTHEPPASNEPAMSEEEKMREAERLFVLFERLKKTGVMEVKNPVEEALQSGCFEELE